MGDDPTRRLDTSDPQPPARDGRTTPLAARPSVGSSTSGLAPGTLLARRWEVRRFVARGGMGEVWEAWDRELSERVALKTIRADFADPEAVERFRREIRLAHKVSHPNVCRVYDLGRDDSGPEAVVFLTMEYLEGPTLTDHVRSAGRLAVSEALPIVRQLAEALDAGHRRGIVHRDFKSSNVILVSSDGRGSTTGPLHAVVTDFGLARSAAVDATATSMSGEVVGTPAYMAPEQVEGRPAGPAADLYALGIVAFEMVTGSLPFVGDSAISTAVQRLRQPAPSPRHRVPDLDVAWERSILRCLEREPEKRFASAGEFVRSLEGEQVSARRRPGRLAVALGAALLTGALAVGWFVRKEKAETAPGATPAGAPAAPRAPLSARRSLAVVGFRNLAARAESDWLRPALGELLSAEMRIGGALRAVSGENVARMRTELGLTEAGSFASDTLAAIRRNLQVDLVATGTYFALGAGSGHEVRLDVSVQETVSGEVSASASATGIEADLPALVAKVGGELRSQLGVTATTSDPGAMRALLPSSPEATRLYAAGLERLQGGDALAARDLLAQAVAADPRHALARSALAQAFGALGYDAKAREEAAAALPFAEELSREDRGIVEARNLEAQKKWDDAARSWKALFDFAPDEIEYGLKLASAELFANRPKDALATVARLRALPPPANGDPRIDLMEAGAAGVLGDADRKRALAAKAGEDAGSAGRSLLRAKARALETGALIQLSRLEEAARAAEEARATWEAAGDRSGVATAENLLGNVAWARSDLDAAKRHYEAAERTFSALGHRRGEAIALNNLANVAGVSGKDDEARRRFTQSLAVARELGDSASVSLALGNLALIHERTGKLDEASAALDESIGIARASGNRSQEATSLHNRAKLAQRRGDLEGAHDGYGKAAELFRAIGDRASLAKTLNSGGVTALDLADLALARNRFDESRALGTELGDPVAASTALGNLASLEIAAANWDAARKDAAEAVTEKRAAKDREGLTYALLHQAEIEAATGTVAAARERAREALKEAEALGRADRRGAATLALAALDRIAADAAAAEEGSRRALALAREAGDRSLAFDARLMLAELALDARRPRVARVDATALVREGAVGPRRAAAARETLARGLLALGDRAGAQQELARATAIGSLPVAAGWNEATAIRVAATVEGIAEARARAVALRAEAGRLGDRRLVFESELLLAELEAPTDSAAAAARLEALVAAARGAGHERVARRAEALLAGGATGRAKGGVFRRGATPASAGSRRRTGGAGSPAR